MKIKTKYVRDKVKGKSFRNRDDREYIELLITLEHFIIEGPKHMAEGMAWGNYQRQYKEECEAIKDELYPGWRRKEAQHKRREREKQRKEDEEVEKIIKKQDASFKKSWIEAGGKP